MIALVAALPALVHAQEVQVDTTGVLDEVQELESSAVVAQKTLVKMEVDKITYKVEDDVDSKTSTVLDMLRKVPMVSVDAQDNITVNGSSSFVIYVDGKPNPVLSGNPSLILKMTPASVVKNIEVVTNPGAQYDAEGVGGVLNITTLSSQPSVSDNTISQYANVTLQGSTRGFGGGVYYGLNKGKWAFSFNGNASQIYNAGTISETERILLMDSGDLKTGTYGEADVRTPVYLGNMSLSYEIDSLNLISVGAGYLGTHVSYKSLYRTEFSGPSLEYSYDGTIISRNSSNSITANIDYQHTWAGRPQRSMVFSYQFSGTPSDTDMTDENVRRTDGFTNSLSHTLQADFSTPLDDASAHKLNVGAKFIARHNSSDQRHHDFDGGDYIFVPQASVEYDFHNTIGALYAEYDGTFGNLGLKAGARYEHTWQNVRYALGQGSDYRMNYGNLVPNASLQYNISMQQNIGLSYNMRISRPGITFLNPYIDNISDPTALIYGNPDLEAELGHTLNLIYNYFSPKWIVNLTLRQGITGNGISQYSFYDSDYILNTTYGNIVSTSTTGLNAFVTWIPGSKTRIIFNGGGSYVNIRSEKLQQANHGWTFNALLGLQQTLPWDLRLSTNIIASGRTVTLQGWNSGLAAGTIGLTKSFLDDRLSLSVSGLTHLTGGRRLTIKSVSQTKDFISNTSTGIPLRMISFNLSFSFGRQERTTVKKARKTIEQEDQLNTRPVTETVGTMIQM